MSNTLVGNRGNYTFLWQLLVLISQHSILSVFEQRMTLYAGKALSTCVLYPFTGLYMNDKPYLMNTKAENCSYRKGQSVDIIKRHLKLQWMLDRSVTISKYKIFNRKTWAESRLQIGFWRYEILTNKRFICIQITTFFNHFQKYISIIKGLLYWDPPFFYRFSGTHHKGLDFCFSIIKKETLTQRPTQTFWRDHKLYFYTIK